MVEVREIFLKLGLRSVDYQKEGRVREGRFHYSTHSGNESSGKVTSLSLWVNLPAGKSGEPSSPTSTPKNEIHLLQFYVLSRPQKNRKNKRQYILYEIRRKTKRNYGVY